MMEVCLFAVRQKGLFSSILSFWDVLKDECGGGLRVLGLNSVASSWFLHAGAGGASPQHGGNLSPTPRHKPWACHLHTQYRPHSLLLLPETSASMLHSMTVKITPQKRHEDIHFIMELLFGENLHDNCKVTDRSCLWENLFFLRIIIIMMELLKIINFPVCGK